MGVVCERDLENKNIDWPIVLATKTMGVYAAPKNIFFNPKRPCDQADREI